MAGAAAASARFAGRLGGKGQALGLAAFSFSSAFVLCNSQKVEQRSGLTQCDASPKPRATLKKRMTAVGRFSVLSESTTNPSIVTLFMCLTGKEPLSVGEVTALWKERGMSERHPRFHQTVSSDSPGYFVDERDSKMESEDGTTNTHISETLTVAGKKDILSRMRNLQTTPFDLTESLWHMWVVPEQPIGSSGAFDPSGAAMDDSGDHESLLVFQAHHALADGASVAAVFLDLIDEAELCRKKIVQGLKARRKKAKTLLEVIYKRLLQLVWFLRGSIRSMIYTFGLFARGLWEADPWTTIRDLHDDVLSRSLSFSQAAPLAQAKWIATTLGGEKATINDVLCSCVTAALATQLDHHRRRLKAVNDLELPVDSHMNIAVPVHLKGGVVLPGESIGNNIGAFVVRLPGELPRDGIGEGCCERLKDVHSELYAVKRTPTAILSHMMVRGAGMVAGMFPKKFVSWLYAKSNAGSIAVVSNNRGSPEHVHLGGRRVEGIYGFVPLPPGVPIGIALLSYADNLYVTVTAESWAVPDTDQFTAWMLDEYMLLLKEAKRQHRKSSV